MRKQDKAYLQGQRLFSDESRNTWVIYSAVWDFTDKDWRYHMILQNNSQPKIREVYGEQLQGLIKRRKLKMI
jgi:hypothetical protein